MIRNSKDETTSGEQAAYWLSRRMSGAMTDGESAAFAAWLGSSPANRAAFSELEAVLTALEPAGDELLAAEFERQLEDAAGATQDEARRSFTRIAAGIAAALVISTAAFVGIRYEDGRQPLTVAEFETAKGEQRTVAFADGSEAELNTDTRLVVEFSKTSRAVELVEGEAFFSVEKDKARPFTVKVGGASVKVTGTSFNVAHFDDKTMVQVLTGVVEVTPVSGSASTLLTGDMIEIGADGNTRAITRYDPNIFLSWRTGKVRFRERPLSEVIASLNRYYDRPIALDAPAFSARPVTGDFDVSDDEGAVRALALIFDLEVREEPSRVVLETRSADDR